MRENDVAVIGMACRFPGADNYRQFWDNLSHARSAIGAVPADRWNTADRGDGSLISRWGGFLTGVDAFDAAFFRLSPLEAQSMDPQQRIMLELAWSCIEDAAIAPSSLAGTGVGVFLGTFNLDYKDLYERQVGDLPAHHSTGTATAVVANRISHVLDLRGPSVAVDSASSASLHAVHLAVQSVQRGECRAALAGGVNLMLTPARHLSFAKAGMLSPTGTCKAFDATADGYVRGEGAGIVLLKALPDAVRDGDDILGVIKGSAANHAGRTRTLTYPSADAQAAVIAEALRRAEVPPGSVSYVEAHGTGTPVGDPVEVEGLIEGFRRAGAGTGQPCGLGSVKTNIGHLEAAAGIAGLIKVLLAMRHHTLPATLNHQHLNPRISFAGTPFFVVDATREWPADGGPRRAGVSSFGFGGTNVHVVLEEAPPSAPAPSDPAPAHLVCLSARTPEALEQRGRDLNAWLDEAGEVDLGALSATLLTGRDHFPVRAAHVVRDLAELRAVLAGNNGGDQAPAPLRDKARDYCAGVDPAAIADGIAASGRPLRLPAYPFQRHRFWITPDPSSQPPAPGAASEPERNTGMPQIEELLECDLEQIAMSVLQLNNGRIHSSDKMADHGFDSIANTRLAVEIAERYGVKITPDVFYSHFTLGQLTQFLLREHGDALARAYDEQPPAAAPAAPAAAPAAPAAAPAASAAAPAASAAGPVDPPSKEAPPVGRGAPADEKDVDAGKIAVIGMSGRFPGARTVDEMWELLAEGRTAVGPLPADRLATWRQFPGVDTEDIRGGWLPGAAEFDPMFFEISPADAQRMDPRQRLLLQESWRALEDAGYGPHRLSTQRMGMFVGAEQGDYQHLTGDEETLISGHDGILAARLAYFLNFSGPVLSLNTACSAGLAAVHQACLSLRAGECDTALAAGVNILTTPQFYRHATASGMLSPDATCSAFGRNANGMVMAEAVAVVVLKPLAKARADGDRIDAVISASGLNYDGRTNGITAPSQQAQTRLLDTVYQQFEVDPAQIDLVIAHGTGTPLGDPIELNALGEIYGRSTDRAGQCALISTKPAFGHTLAASGVLSLIALVQALRHETIPASLHCAENSEYIDWSRSPFVVNKQPRPWPHSPSRRRRGAVSAFGISGTNAHIVVDSAPADDRRAVDVPAAGCLLVLSGKTAEALSAQAADLLAALHGRADDDLAGISTTLLTGRHHFAHRCALVVTGIEQAERLLERVLRDERDPAIIRGTVTRDFRAQPLLAGYGNELLTRAGDPARAAGEQREILRALADLYCQGYELQWTDLTGGTGPAIRLPGYPFARETYWASRTTPEPQDVTEALHPLLDRNTSTVTTVEFSKTLSREAFYLRDHVVDGKILLPGVAHLEMAYAATRLATGAPAIVLRDIIWGHPIVLDEASTTVQISLTPGRGAAVDYQIHRGTGDTRTTFSQGRAEYAEQHDGFAPATLDLPAIQARCVSQMPNAGIYPYLRDLGFGYGPTFQAIETLHQGDTEALAKIVLTAGLVAGAPRFTMHPSVFDAALNTLRGIGTQDDVLRIPFSLQTLVVFAPMPAVAYCHATINRVARDGAISVDLSITGEDGVECVRAIGLVFKEFSAAKDGKVLHYVPRWHEQPLAGSSPQPPTSALVVLGGDETAAAALRSAHRGRLVHVQHGPGYAEPAADTYRVDRHSAADLDRLIRTLHQRDGLPPVLVNLWSLTGDGEDPGAQLLTLLPLFKAVHRLDGDDPVHLLSGLPVEPGPARLAGEALNGFGRAMTTVNPTIRLNTVQVNTAGDPAAIAADILTEVRATQGPTARGGYEARYTDGMRWERGLHYRGTGLTVPDTAPLKENGVYLITGGTGALGTHFGRYLAEHCRARLALLGRSPLDDSRRARLAELEAAGAEVFYQVCDVAERDDVRRALNAIRARFGTIDGILHGAGVAGDTPALASSPQQVSAVLAPKVHGVRHLDELTADVPLDFFIMFSSIAAQVGDFGQGSYAAANRYLDAYAEYRDQQRQAGLRHGRSIAIGWPYWADGGMLGDLEQDGEARTLYHDVSGLRALSTPEGLDAFAAILAGEQTQVVLAKGDRSKIEKVLRVGQSAATSPAAPVVAVKATVMEVVAEGGGEDLHAQAAGYLKAKLSEVFKIPQNRIDPVAELGEYGIESIQIMELMRRLGKDFDAIPGTLFFEYRTIQELAGYFVAEQAERLRSLLGTTQTPAPAAVPAAATPAPRAVTRVSAPEPAAQQQRAGGRSRDIAIIGISGRYPGARDLDEFWDVLASGADCIEEIPAHRWDKDKHYDPEKKPGKTYSKWGGFIDGADEFDALFFAMSPKQAALTDPQGRLFLQSAWEAMEDAGYTRDSLTGDKARKVGVYLGMMWNEYQLHSTQDVVLSDRAAASNAVSYFLNLHGPSLTVDTACSSSLYAIAMAVEAIRSGSATMAFAGGANLSLHPNKYVSLSQMNFFSTDGRCRSFGAGGSGYVPGEGVGCVLLKPMDAAVADGDHIYGVIRGVATDHGGKTNGMTVPNPLAQGEMVAAALADAGISAEDVSYIEGHGTGTPLGDPIEINGLTRAFRPHTDRRQYCAIGSVKSNVGHLEGAAGIVALTKVLLQMKHGMIAPSLHSGKLNPYIDFSTTPFRVQQDLAPWTSPRIAGVSSFGAHGAIAHLIIEEYVPEPRPAVGTGEPELIVLSAKDRDRLAEKVRDLHRVLAQQPRDTGLADIAWTLQAGREAMEERLALVVATAGELSDRLAGYLAGDDTLTAASIRDHKDTVAAFRDEQDQRAALHTWMETGQLDRLAEVWTQGVPVDWTALPRTARPRRVSLPTYPFARERHWLTAPEPQHLETPAPTPAPVEVPLLTFVEDWQPQTADTAGADRIVSIVCLGVAGEHQTEILDAVRAQHPAATVSFDLTAAPAADTVFDLSALQPGATLSDLGPLVHTVQAIARATTPVRRLLIAGEYRDGLDRAHLEARIGFERSLGLVLPQLSTAVVIGEHTDPARPAGYGGWIRRPLAEARTAKPVSVLFRAGQRFVKRVRPAAPLQAGDGLKRGGTYLITGGCGGLGMLVATHLVTHYQASIVLTGRSALDADRQRKLDALRSLGGRVEYLPADVADPQAMAGVVAQARRRFGALHGVVHAAGVQGQQSILDKDPAAREILAPKIDGTQVLDQVLSGEQLDFVCYFSSTAAVLGDFGSCDYAIGNRFQMAYAAHRDEQVDAGTLTGRTVVINWPLWREGGMGFDDGATTMMLRSTGQRLLDTDAGLGLFTTLLAQPTGQHLVFAGEPERLHQVLGISDTAVSSEGRHDDLTADLRRIISDVLAVAPERIYEDDNLADYGFDSVSLATLAARLSEHFGLQLTAVVFYGQSTLGKLRDYLAREHPAQLEALYRNAAPHHEHHEHAEERPESAGDDEAVAVIGMSGRFPGARDVTELWAALAEGRDQVRSVDAERLALWGEPADSALRTYRFGQIPGPAEFDPLFFEISPKEAVTMDPRQRLLLQESWRALEDAGMARGSQRTGMFVGAEQGDYADLSGGDGVLTANHDGILAARLAYFLDFKGPVMALNTACSSGLVAVHQACQSIRQGECDTALAAGVSLIAAPGVFHRTQQAGMLSPDGTCYAFDKRANGMVLSEAVAVVVLKRLSAAVADGDRIHAVIRGSGVNYDGRSNGITAPDAPAQTDLLTGTYQRYGINPAGIDLVLAHGTGTRLGDPIEIAALTEAFRRHTDRRQFCALTAVKSSLGHTLAASGIVNLIAAIQALHHDTIPASLHCEQQSDYVDWAASPFFVNQANRSWPQNPERPRRAALSSFGMSGTNAHLVIEDHPQPAPAPVNAPAYLLVLSARTEQALRQRISDLLTHLTGPTVPDLARVSATLLEGRHHLTHRYALVAATLDEATRLLRSATGAPGGVVPKGCTPDPEAAQRCAHLAERAATGDPVGRIEALHELAHLYCQGHTIDARRLLGGTRVPPVSLPGYPFARKQLWTRTRPAGFFVTDHVVAGTPVLPGVAHLELARAAAAGQATQASLRDVVWLRPITGTEPLDARVELDPAGADGTRYRVLTTTGGTPVVSSQGRVVPVGTTEEASLDLPALHEACGAYRITADECYAIYRRRGIDYGPAYRGVAQILVGDAQVLAELRLPAELAGTLDSYGLHPSLLDAALQASTGLPGGTDATALPFAVERLDLLRPLTATAWAWVRPSAASNPAAMTGKLDIDVCDAEGRVSVRIRGFSVRPMPLAEPAEPAESESEPAGAAVLMHPRWVPATPQGSAPAGPILLVGDDPAVLGGALTGDPKVRTLLLRAEDTIDTLRARLTRDAATVEHIVWIAGGTGTAPLLTRQENGLYPGFRMLKALLELGAHKRTLHWTVIAVGSQAVGDSEAVDPAPAGVLGMMASAAKEIPGWSVRLADLSEVSDAELRQAFTVDAQPGGGLWAYRKGSWWRQTLAPVPSGATYADLPYRDGGVYVIVGGAGGLGSAWTEHLLRHHRAQVIWIGRRAEDDTIRGHIRELAALGPAPWYVQADAADPSELQSAVTAIKARFPRINGVVHSAITLDDQSIARMSEERFRAAVRAKADVSVHLADAFAGEPLDFLLFFSSLNSFLRSAGQSNYVAGSMIEDAVAHQLTQRLAYPVRTMNWGYWGSVGVVADASYQRRLALNGFGSITPAEGMAALDVLLRSSHHQLALTKDSTTGQPPDPREQQLQRVADDSGEARGYTDELLCELLAAQLRAAGLMTSDRPVAGPGRRWLEQSMRYLNAYNAETAGEAEAWRRWEAISRERSDSPYVALLDRTLRALPDLLTGRIPATDVLFPGSSFDLVEGIYRRCASASALNEIVAAEVEAVIGRRDGVRILEIGAGTGGTTATVLSRLNGRSAAVAEYRFTDVSQLFLRRAREEFSDAHPYLRTSLFDVERDPAAQGLTGPYDIVLATNVLHATRDTRAAVRHTRSLLADGGVLVLNELAAGSLFLHLTFGLLDGWWAGQDSDLRLDGCPGLAPETWRSVLTGAGFDAVSFPAEAVHRHGHQIVVARAASAQPPAAGRNVEDLIIARLQEALGVAAEELHVDDSFADYGVDSITAVDLVQSIGAALGVPLSTTDLFDHGSIRQLAAYVSATWPAPASAPAPAPAPALAPALAAGSSNDIAELIIGRIRQALGLDRSEFAAGDSFRDYGVDSILAVELVQDLNRELGIDLATTDLFDHTSVDALADYVAATYPAVTTATTAPAAIEATPEPEPVSGHEPIAIIGMSGRYGRAQDTAQLWQHLAAGEEIVGPITRWDLSRHHAAGEPFCNAAAMLDDVDLFDPLFFAISGVEATFMDPQQRLVLEESWKALEDAGRAGAGIRDQAVGIYIGTQVSDYLTASHPDLPAQAMWGNAEAVIPARVSYYLNLRGPAVAVDTACSGSLVAIHLAAQALRSGEITMALAGGVSVQCAPDYYLAAEKAGMLSPTGHCHTFDNRADGFVPGEGVGVVVLKLLRDAIADGDHVHGVIRASGLNQDGTSNGITAPSARSQERLIRDVYDTAGVNPEQIQLVEAHGTGTKLGDPIEFQALTRAFRHYTERTAFCALGSIKTNIGHAAPAAGVAGLFKILLGMRHREIPRTLHFDRLNEHIAGDNSPFRIATEHQPWPAGPDGRRRAALSSFGFSGTNAHLVIEDAPATTPARTHRPGYLIALSALSAEQLRTCADRLLIHLREHPGTDPGDVSLTLLLGRRPCEHRLAFVAADLTAITDRLQRWLTGDQTADPAAVNSTDAQQSLDHCAHGAGDDTAYLRHLGVLADHFRAGGDLDWARLFDGTHRRTPLPTYPFARQRYWHTTTPAPAVEPAVDAVTEPPADDDHVTLTPVWTRLPTTAEDSAPTGPVVLVGGDESLRASCPAAVVLTDLDEVRRVGDIEHIVWAATGDAGEPVLHRVEDAPMALFRLIRALLDLGYGDRALRWSVVTRQAHPVHPGEAIDPAGAAVLGLAGVLGKEFPDWQVRLLDAGSGDTVTAAMLWRTSGPELVAVRDGHWFQRRLARTELTAAASSPYRDGGVYVVLGGAGGLGRLWSENVIRRHRAQLVWIGRREAGDPVHAAIEQLAALGPAPVYLRADAADRNALHAAYTTIKQRFGRIDGVVHSAFGVVDQSLSNTTTEQFRHGLTAKIDATVHLAEVFGAEPLDFLLFFSSIAAFSTTMGYCSYVTSNAFEDAFARRLAATRSYPVKVINWGYWGAVGSGLDVPAHVRERFYQQGFGDITPARGLDAVTGLLGAPGDQIAYLNVRDPRGFEALTAGVTAPPAVPSEPLATALPARTEDVARARTGLKTQRDALDTALARLLYAELRTLGWLGTDPVSADTLRQRHGITGTYTRWLDEALRVLTAAGLIQQHTGGYAVAPAAPAPDEVQRQWREQLRGWASDPALQSSVELVTRTVPVLTGILTGRVSAVDVIFPGSSLQYVENVYQGNPIVDHFNQVTADSATELIRRRLTTDPGARVRILEIGAGTGGTTATVLPALRPRAGHISEYCYTDLSRAFLVHGRQQFGADHPYLRCELLDATRPVAAQGFDEGGYDLVIATNVLHATRDVREALRNARSLLRPGGAVLINEIAGHTVFGLLTFGLLDGWWLYDDAEIREPGGPGLSAGMWQSVLEWEGYSGVEFPAAGAHDLGQLVVVGRQSGETPAATTETVAPVSSEADVEAYLRTIIARTLMIPAASIVAREPLATYGLDSILVMQLTNALRKDLGEFASTLFFEYRTVAALAEHLRATKATELAALLGPAQPAAPVVTAPQPAPVRPQPPARDD
ncbi:SDR family NAD(P)-dependent oxidoreductase, partial [Actinoplanes sp. TFC3]|uniref:SDR family NAD(P)-dependent oxidoreductase n=1 Tax=Actinoplanes sp. TFC3 TaxID=1710355 RepID=UPI000836B4ED